MQAMVARWYRKSALAHHPDRFGSDARMRVVNEIHRELLDEIRAG
jgi:hypothetical protein